ncbi:hypothetical protein RFI_01248 [Reticulomyxa filosa]|uniref:Uncharacterized protein n=1 Tax=Reticulomyxa filosa TaxID=46433 RepID=X6PCL5_RETFI|nr:hypothetical protein RFI_01248 [Reticulomyxa filosa]|eukprot:ETO35814.1 hypothetical protein RFI_01248 [Reticulomyxa filosa]
MEITTLFKLYGLCLLMCATVTLFVLASVLQPTAIDSEFLNPGTKLVGLRMNESTVTTIEYNKTTLVQYPNVYQVFAKVNSNCDTPWNMTIEEKITGKQIKNNSDISLENCCQLNNTVSGCVCQWSNQKLFAPHTNIRLGLTNNKFAMCNYRITYQYVTIPLFTLQHRRYHVNPCYDYPHYTLQSASEPETTMCAKWHPFFPSLSPIPNTRFHSIQINFDFLIFLKKAAIAMAKKIPVGGMFGSGTSL